MEIFGERPSKNDHVLIPQLMLYLISIDTLSKQKMCVFFKTNPS